MEYLSIDPNITASLLALALGAIIGLEREIVQQRSGNPSFGGIRTFAFIGLLGAISGILGKIGNPNLSLAGFLGIIILIGVSYYADRTHHKKRVGLTSEITALLTFMTGLLTAYENALLAIICTVLIITTLALRSYLHKFAKNIDNKEIYASIEFAIIAFIILPLLPNTTFDPWQALNPKNIWMIVVLISGLNFIGYILNKVFGDRKGMALTGFFGGFVSSTAVSLSVAEQSSKKRISYRALLIGLLLAQTSSLILTIIELSIFNKELLTMVYPPLLMVIIILIITAGYQFKHCKDRHKTIENNKKAKSPFTLSQALIFGLTFTIVMLTIRILGDYIGKTGLFITSIFSGMISLDAITLTVANFAGDSVEYILSTKILLVGIISSVAQKILILALLSKGKFKKQAILHLIVIIAVMAGYAIYF